jgi:hypothetical protein
MQFVVSVQTLTLRHGAGPRQPGLLVRSTFLTTPGSCWLQTSQVAFVQHSARGRQGCLLITAAVVLFKRLTAGGPVLPLTWGGHDAAQ